MSIYDIFFSILYPLVWVFLAVYSAKKFNFQFKNFFLVAFVLLAIRSLIWPILRLINFSQYYGEIYQVIRIVDAVLLVVAVILIIKSLHTLSAIKGDNDAYREEFNVSRANGSVMRYLLSSAFLNGAAYRSKVLDFVKSDIRLMAPENGVDLPLLVNTCEKLDTRDYKYEWFFTCLIITFFIVMAVMEENRVSEEITVSVLMFILGIAGLAWIVKDRNQRKWVSQFFIDKNFSEEEFKQAFLGDDVNSNKGYEQGNNIVVYDGFNPFVGAGMPMDGWSISIDLTKKKDDLSSNQEIQNRNFELDELYASLSKNLENLGFSNLSIKDMLFVNGTDVKDIDWILPNKYQHPISSVNEETIKNFYASSNKEVRHYKLVQVAEWQNNIILSFYIRFSLQSDNLFVEVSRFLLTPVAPEYRKVDRQASLSKRKKFSTALLRLLFGGLYAAYSTMLMLARIQKGIAEIFVNTASIERKQIDKNPLFNYGAKTTLRENFSGEEYLHYFQKLDKELYFKTLERSFLDSIVNFLDSHNIDTNELGESRTTIINSGIIVKGGDVNAGALAVGKKAKAKNS